MTPLATLALLASEGGGSPVEKLLSAQPGIWLWTLGIFILLFWAFRSKRGIAIATPATAVS